MLRYVVLTITLTLATISPEVLKEYSFEDLVKKGQPACCFFELRTKYLTTLSGLVNKYMFLFSGFLKEEEKKLLNKHNAESGQQVAWVPIMWASQIVHRSRQAGRITSDLGQKSITDEMLSLRVSCGRLFGFNSHNIPLVYVQVG